MKGLPALDKNYSVYKGLHMISTEIKLWSPGCQGPERGAAIAAPVCTSRKPGSGASAED